LSRCTFRSLLTGCLSTARCGSSGHAPSLHRLHARVRSPPLARPRSRVISFCFLCACAQQRAIAILVLTALVGDQEEELEELLKQLAAENGVEVLEGGKCAPCSPEDEPTGSCLCSCSYVCRGCVCVCRLNPLNPNPQPLNPQPLNLDTMCRELHRKPALVASVRCGRLVRAVQPCPGVQHCLLHSGLGCVWLRLLR